MSQQRQDALRWMIVLISVATTVALCAWRYKAVPITQHPSDCSTVTFARDVAPIVFAKCSPCHHPGEAAPFSLLTYDDVRRRARQIVDVTQKAVHAALAARRRGTATSSERDG